MESEMELCRAAASLEDPIAKLAGGFLRRVVSSVYTGTRERLNPLRNWIWLRNAAGETAALAFEVSPGQEDGTDYFFRLLDLAAVLGAADSPFAGWFLVEECPGFTPRLELDFSLRDEESAQIGRMQVALSSPVVLLNLQSCSSWALERLGQQKTELALWKGQSSTGHGWMCAVGEEQSFLLEEADSSEGKVSLLVKEVLMKREDLEEKLQVGVYLGGIAISLDDLLRLRPGMNIEFARPVAFPVTIRAGGGDWAKGSLSFAEGTASLQVDKLLAVENSCSGQETLGEIPRLVSGETSNKSEFSI